MDGTRAEVASAEGARMGRYGRKLGPLALPRRAQADQQAERSPPLSHRFSPSLSTNGAEASPTYPRAPMMPRKSTRPCVVAVIPACFSARGRKEDYAEQRLRLSHIGSTAFVLGRPASGVKLNLDLRAKVRGFPRTRNEMKRDAKRSAEVM